MEGSQSSLIGIEMVDESGYKVGDTTLSIVPNRNWNLSTIRIFLILRHSQSSLIGIEIVNWSNPLFILSISQSSLIGIEIR